MAWFRRPTGELIHAVDGLEVVCENRGWEIVDDETAQAEVAAMPAAPKRGGPKPLVRVQVKHQPKAKLTGLEKVRVEKAVKEEAPRPRRRNRDA